MPYSSRDGKELTAQLLLRLDGHFHFRRILDVGAGSGTYSLLLRSRLPQAEWTALEIWEPWRERFELDQRYNRVIMADARSWEIDGDYDLVLMGDILEHMQKAEAQDLVLRLLHHCQLLLIAIPIVPMAQEAWEGNPYEAHIKDDWSDAEVRASFPNISLAFIGAEVGVYLLSSDQGVHEVVQLLIANLASDLAM
ncbi:MAG TPA: class I SAM-dependent methyltransferase, partial [Candidatus Obscuribacterales bacterium]